MVTLQTSRDHEVVFFYFEHPLTASSWTMPELDQLRSRSDVEDVVLHMCSFGLSATDGVGEGLVKKPTRVLTNMPSIASALDRRCSEDHRHVMLLSGKAKAAAQYTNHVCSAIVQGLQVHIEYAGQVAEHGAFAVECGELGNVEEEEEHIPFAFDDSGWCQDDVRGGSLPMDLVREGRRTEIEGFTSRRVYVLRPRYEAKAKGARVVGVRWVDTQKGDKVRSRLVCQDFNTDKGHNDEMFAATPPLLASRWLVSLVASQGAYGLGPTRLMALDFSKAFLYGNMKREVYIELPNEDARKGDGDWVGLLLKSMYGLRDAPQIWQAVVKNMLEERGFKHLVGTQCTYVCAKSGMLIVAHVDDFLVSGTRIELTNFLKGLQNGGFECTGLILGDGQEDVQELKFLGRTIRLVEGGLEWEGDSKHVAGYLDKLNSDFSDVEPGMHVVRGSVLRGVRTPGVKRTDLDEFAERIALSPALSKAYRGLAALANFMAQDRVDISFAAKEISKCMSSPARADVGPLKRLGRYLTAYPSCASLYCWQDPPLFLDGFSDSDWGGDVITRRSTRGGCLLHGEHLLGHWSRTQQVISLSSAEAELHALCKCASEGLSARNMTIEMHLGLPLRISTDSSAARGIVQRQGAGKVKHLDVKSLWIQERETNGDLVCLKVPRLDNWSDLLTHHWSDAEGDRHLAGMSVIRRSSPVQRVSCEGGSSEI